MIYKCPNGPACCVHVSVCLSACWGQLGRIWALQLLWTAVCVGERRVSSLGVVERQQRLPHWEDDVLPPHLLRCELLFPSSELKKHHIWLIKLTHLGSEPRFLMWQAYRVTYTSCWLQLRIELVHYKNLDTPHKFDEDLKNGKAFFNLSELKFIRIYDYYTDKAKTSRKQINISLWRMA